MSPFPTAHCCRVVRTHLRPQCDSIWIPDALLYSAFERFRATAPAAARHASSVPGPMESRRRVGKRHMGELNLGQPHAAAPLWALENLVDLSQWTWKPPKTPEVLSRRDTASHYPARGLAGLAENAAETTLPVDVLLPEDTVLAGVAELMPAEEESLVEEASAEEARDASAICRDVVTVGMEILYLELLHAAEAEPQTRVSKESRNRSDPVSQPVADVLPRFATFCDGWRQSLANARYDGQHIISVLDGIAKGVDTINLPLSKQFVAEAGKRMFYESTTQGMGERQASNSTCFESSVWNHLLHRISGLGLVNIPTFASAIARIPDSCFDGLASGVAANLEVHLRALGSARQAATLARQTSKMAAALKPLRLGDHPQLLHALTEKVLLHAQILGPGFCRMRLAWLQLVSKLPGLDLDYPSLALLCVKLDDLRFTRPLSATELCRIFLTRAHFLAPLKHHSYLYQSLEDGDLYCCKELAAKLWDSEQYSQFTDLMQFLQHLGREHSVMEVVRGARRTGTNVVRTLANAVIGIGKPSLAVRVLYLWIESIEHPRGFWDSPFGAEAMTLLMDAPSPENHPRVYRTLMKSLNIHPSRRRWRRVMMRGGRRAGPVNAPARQAALNHESVSRVVQLARAAARSPNLSRRTTFGIISRCMRTLRSRTGRIPSDFMPVLLRSVTEDLREGRPGITSRLRWFLYILHREVGAAETQKTRQALSRWRDINTSRVRATEQIRSVPSWVRQQ